MAQMSQYRHPLLVTLTVILLICIPLATTISATSHPQHPLKTITTPFSPATYRLGTILNNLNTQTTDDPKDFQFTPLDMTLADDAYHGSNALSFTEWWYFDATFENDYSVQLSIRVLSAFKQGLIFARLDLYHDGEIVQHTQKRYLIQQMTASSTIPNVKLNGNQHIYATEDPETGNWIYHLTFDHDILTADITFTSLTQGWKGQLKGGDWWGVALPRATTEGTITYHDSIIDCTGIGYHDHNWEVAPTAGLNFGWIWGKIHADQHTITWSNVYTTRFLSQPLLVLNKNDDTYYNLPVDNIEFIADDFVFEKRRFIPHTFTITAHTKDIEIDIQLAVIDIHHVRLYGILNYWRFHVHSTGTIIHGTDIDHINDIHIAEIIRFR